MLRLPPELQDEIISLLQYDKKSLSTCALVCRTLLPLCQKYLYAGVTIESTTRPNALSSIQFQQILSKWTYLLGAVQYIEIIDTESSSIRGETPEWLSGDRALARSLPQLHSLKGFSIRYRQDQWQNWEGLSEGLLRAIIEKLSSPSLAYLHIENVPLAFLRFCPNIKYLSVAGHPNSSLNSNRVLFMPIPPIFQPPGGICTLESLRIAVGALLSASGPASWLLNLKANGMDLRKLKVLHAGVNGSLDDHGIVRSVLEDCASTLEEFVFDPSIETCWEPFPAGRLDFGIMKRLRTLAVRMDIVSANRLEGHPALGDWSDSMPWFVGLLKTFASAGQHPLEVLRLRVNHATEDGLYSAEPWVEMANFLGNNETFPSFRNLELRFCSYNDQKKGIAAFSRLASDLASRLEGVRVHAVFSEAGFQYGELCQFWPRLPQPPSGITF